MKNNTQAGVNEKPDEKVITPQEFKRRIKFTIVLACFCFSIWILLILIYMFADLTFEKDTHTRSRLILSITFGMPLAFAGAMYGLIYHVVMFRKSKPSTTTKHEGY
jgi:uncharacterized membrane protein (DUF485 family)